jgi:hypothetical protein
VAEKEFNCNEEELEGVEETGRGALLIFFERKLRFFGVFGNECE